jgi:tetraacyldisaccharide 4'-kinase
MLEGLGAELVDCESFADHHRYRRAEVERLLRRAAREDALCITTSKDAVRLPQDLRASVVVFPVAVLWRDMPALERVLDPALAQARCR